MGDRASNRDAAAALARTLQATADGDLTRTFGQHAATLDASIGDAASDGGPNRTLLPRITFGDGAETRGVDLELAGVLGEGGMGVVSLARQRSLRRDVAIKRVRDPANARAVGALMVEAQVTGSLEHPNIVPVHALGTDARGQPVMVMKRLEGVTLQALIDDPEHPGWAEIEAPDRLAFFVGVVRRLCDALAFAHARGFVHRDVKPDNVMIGRYGEVTLLDWGVAIREGIPLAPDAIAGTPVYMAPEMLYPHLGEIDARSDVFLLAATLHHCLTGTPPHHGATLGEVFLAADEARPPAYGAETPVELASVLRRAMDRQREKRPADVREFARALDGFLRHRDAAALARVGASRIESMCEAIERMRPPVEIHGLFLEARFALEQALHTWPEHPSARSEIRRGLEAMCSFEIAQGNAGAARALLAAMDPPPATLVERVTVLEREVAARQADRDRLRRIVHDQDERVGARERRLGIRVMAIAGAPIIVLMGVLIALGTVRVTTQLLAVMTVPPVAVLGALMYRFRSGLLANRISRQMAFTVMVLITLIALRRVLGVLRSAPLLEIASGDCFVVAGVAAISALTLRRLFLVVALLFIAAGTIIPLIRDWIFLPVAAAGLLSMVLVLRGPRSLQRPLLAYDGDDSTTSASAS